MTRASKSPKWVWLIIGSFALIEPLTHLWLRYGLDDSVAHSGLHIGDTPFFSTDMALFGNDFYSPYLACEREGDRHDMSLFALPHHWLYATLGWMARLVGLDPFLMLGLANGIAGALFLLALWRFFVYVAPQQASLAFLLLTLGGGLGGVVWLLSGVLGGHESAGFEGWFHRFARYELIEGPFLSPALLLPRLYYTLPLALGFIGLLAFIGSLGRGLPMPGKRSVVLQVLATLLNARVGLLMWGVAACFILVQPGLPRKQRIRYVAYYLLGTLAAALLVHTAFGMNIAGSENVSELLRRSAWFGSLITATFWLWPAVLLALWHHSGKLPWGGRLLLGWGAGYGACFAVLYVAHQVWYGNLLAGGESAAAIAISDWALLGIIPGTLLLLRKTDSHPLAASESWIALWFLGLACLAISAFGQGWFLRLLPERCLVLMGPPMALLAAEGLLLFRTRVPRLTTAYTALIVVCGLCSLGVSTLCFQGPLGHQPGVSPFAWVHSELVLPEDLEVMDHISQGTVLAPASAPPLLGDVVVLRRPGTRAVFGQPTLEYGGVNMLRMSEEVQEFFRPETAEVFRQTFILTWCVDYILCPATRPVDPAVVEQLRAAPWLVEVAAEGGAVLFHVLRPPGTRGYG